MSQQNPPNLTALPRRCWRGLARGAREADHPWHTPVVATAGAAGPAARTVVLREAQEQRRALVLHTDRRSGKATALARDDRLAWVFWDPRERVQLRCLGRVRLHAGDEVACAAWAGLGDRSRALYGGPLPPGAALKDGAPTGDRVPAGGTGGGFEEFLVVVCTVGHIDWLALDRGGHRRAHLDWRDGAWRAKAVAP